MLTRLVEIAQGERTYFWSPVMNTVCGEQVICGRNNVYFLKKQKCACKMTTEKSESSSGFT